MTLICKIKNAMSFHNNIFTVPMAIRIKSIKKISASQYKDYSIP